MNRNVKNIRSDVLVSPSSCESNEKMAEGGQVPRAELHAAENRLYSLIAIPGPSSTSER